MEYLGLSARRNRREATLLDHYGATNRVEFSVATECFFERPHAMREQHAELYAVLKDFYRQDPAEWLPDAAAPASPASLPRTNLPGPADPATAEEDDCPQWYSEAWRRTTARGS